jgi:hypothetical protein
MRSPSLWLRKRRPRAEKGEERREEIGEIRVSPVGSCHIHSSSKTGLGSSSLLVFLSIPWLPSLFLMVMPSME